MYTYNNSGEKVPTMIKRAVMKFSNGDSPIIEGFSLKSKTNKIILGIAIAVLVMAFAGCLFMYYRNRDSSSTLTESVAPMNFGSGKNEVNRFGFRFY